MPECSQARGETSDWEEVVDVVEGVPSGVRSRAEYEGSIFIDALRRTNVLAASNPETVFDTFQLPTCRYFIVAQSLVVSM